MQALNGSGCCSCVCPTRVGRMVGYKPQAMHPCKKVSHLKGFIGFKIIASVNITIIPQLSKLRIGWGRIILAEAWFFSQ